jgi:hypothetical protein
MQNSLDAMGPLVHRRHQHWHWSWCRLLVQTLCLHLQLLRHQGGQDFQVRSDARGFDEDIQLAHCHEPDCSPVLPHVE